MGTLIIRPPGGHFSQVCPEREAAGSRNIPMAVLRLIPSTEAEWIAWDRDTYIHTHHAGTGIF